MNLIELKLKFCVQSLFKSSDSSLVLDIWTLEVKSPFYLLRFWDWTEDVLSQGKQSLMSPKFLTRRMPPFSLMIAIPTLWRPFVKRSAQQQQYFNVSRRVIHISVGSAYPWLLIHSWSNLRWGCSFHCRAFKRRWVGEIDMFLTHVSTYSMLTLCYKEN